MTTLMIADAEEAAGRRRPVTASPRQGPDGVVVTQLDLSTIKARPFGNARRLDADHLLAIAKSIVEFGMLEPLVVDRVGHLVAGAHRLAALQVLTAPDLESRMGVWEGLLQDAPKTASVTRAARAILSTLPRWPDTKVAVRVLPFDAGTNQKAALAAEVAENEHRRDFTREEAVALANRLRSVGFKDTRGRPRAGELSLGPAMAKVLGRSLRTVRRALAIGGRNPVSKGHSTAPERRLLRAVQQYRRSVGKDMAPGMSALLEKLSKMCVSSSAAQA